MLSIWMFVISIVQADELIRTATWEHVPAIEICPDSPVTKEEILAAMAHWTEVTGERLPYQHIRHVNSCLFRKSRVIRFMDLHEENKLNPGDYAVTYYNHWFYNSAPDVYYMENVSVMIPKQTKWIVIIAHELGHAYGYQHSNHSIMTPTF